GCGPAEFRPSTPVQVAGTVGRPAPWWPGLAGRRWAPAGWRAGTPAGPAAWSAGPPRVPAPPGRAGRRVRGTAPEHAAPPARGPHGRGAAGDAASAQATTWSGARSRGRADGVPEPVQGVVQHAVLGQADQRRTVLHTGTGEGDAGDPDRDPDQDVEQAAGDQE